MISPMSELFALIRLLRALSYILSSYYSYFPLITAGFLALVVMAYFLTGSGSSKE